MGGSDDPVLPPEIWREILARLPVKSVLRCRSVCKSWYSLVSCPNFISHHSLTNLHDKNGNRVLLHHELTFSSHDVYCMESSEHDDFIGRGQLSICSCDGLICLFERDYGDHVSTMNFLIWNPAIRKKVELPSLTYSTMSQYCSHVGFGWDSKTSDYKVMCNLRDVPDLGGNIQKNACQIFDLSKGVWRGISPLVPSHVPRRPQADCYVNGAVHWGNISDRILLSFNMGNECFRTIKMPDCAEFTPSNDGGLLKTKCAAFGGLVHVIVFTMYLDDYVGEFVIDVSKSCSIWAMKEYGVTESWMKVSNIDLRSAQGLPSTQVCSINILIWAEGEFLMMHHLPVDEEDFRKDLVLYNTESKKSKRVFSITKRVYDLCQYKESLLLM